VATLKLKIMRAVNEENDLIAGEVRGRLNDTGVTTFNLMSSPGSGKTSLLEATINALKEEIRFGVIVGDLYTTKDAERICKLDIPVLQLNTEGSCHLTAHMIRESLDEFNLNEIDCLFIENVGNLVCPGSFDLGEDYRIAMVSTAEGNDKIEKYPKMFRMASANIISKIDLIEHVDFDLNDAVAKLQLINPDAPVFALSIRTKEGIEEWLSWVTEILTQSRLEI
jgi:hydrogenase nickel incorporation protein HypB